MLQKRHGQEEDSQQDRTGESRERGHMATSTQSEWDFMCLYFSDFHIYKSNGNGMCFLQVAIGLSVCRSTLNWLTRPINMDRS